MISIQSLIKGCGKKQSVIAKELDVTDSIISTWGCGKIIPRKDRRKEIADYFGVDVDEVLWGDEALSFHGVTVGDLIAYRPFNVGDRVVEIRPISKREKIKLHGTVVGAYPRYFCIKTIWGYTYCVEKSDLITGEVILRREVK